MVDISGPGARVVCAALKKYECLDRSRVLMTGNVGLCAVAALVNGIRALAGMSRVEAAQRVWMKHRLRITKLGEMVHLLYGLKNLVPRESYPCLQLQKVSKQNREDFRKDPFLWMSRCAGVWLIRLEEAQVVDHCVFADGTQGLIFDSANKFPFRLTVRSLRY